MAQPSQSEMLTAAEVLRVREALMDELLMSGLRKVFGFEAKMQAESTENEALTNDPNVSRIIHYAARTRAAREFEQTIRTRMTTLSVKQQ